MRALTTIDVLWPVDDAPGWTGGCRSRDPLLANDAAATMGEARGAAVARSPAP